MLTLVVTLVVLWGSCSALVAKAHLVFGAPSGSSLQLMVQKQDRAKIAQIKHCLFNRSTNFGNDEL